MQSYKEFKEEVETEQTDMTAEEIRQKMQKDSEFQLELDNLPGQTHHWIDRGAKLTCEGVHGFHEVWKRR